MIPSGKGPDLHLNNKNYKKETTYISGRKNKCVCSKLILNHFGIKSLTAAKRQLKIFSYQGGTIPDDIQLKHVAISGKIPSSMLPWQ